MNKLWIVVGLLIVSALSVALPAHAVPCVACFGAGGQEYCSYTSLSGYCTCLMFNVYDNWWCISHGGFCLLGAFCEDEGPPPYDAQATIRARAALEVCGYAASEVSGLEYGLAHDEKGVRRANPIPLADLVRAGKTLRISGAGRIVKNDGKRLICRDAKSGATTVLPHGSSPLASGSWLVMPLAASADLEDLLR